MQRTQTRLPNCASRNVHVCTHARTHARTHVRTRSRRDTAACGVRLFPSTGNVTPATPFVSCGPVTPIQESPADCELAPCRDMGVVEAWETRDQGGCSTAFGEWERTTMSTGDEGSENEMRERKRERERVSERGEREKKYNDARE